MNDDEYMVARQVCMKLFHPNYQILPAAELRLKYYGSEVAFAKKLKTITLQVADEERTAATSSSSGLQPPLEDKGKGKDKGEAKGKDKRKAKGKWK
jgi:hypothetical protein